MQQTAQQTTESPLRRVQQADANQHSAELGREFRRLREEEQLRIDRKMTDELLKLRAIQASD